jgi:hypothetical protein
MPESPGPSVELSPAAIQAKLFDGGRSRYGFEVDAASARQAPAIATASARQRPD